MMTHEYLWNEEEADVEDGVRKETRQVVNHEVEIETNDTENQMSHHIQALLFQCICYVLLLRKR